MVLLLLFFYYYNLTETLQNVSNKVFDNNVTGFLVLCDFVLLDK